MDLSAKGCNKGNGKYKIFYLGSKTLKYLMLAESYVMLVLLSLTYCLIYDLNNYLLQEELQ